jgi:hypothetical protein
MEIFREIKKLGYKHYLPYTIEELDKLSVNTNEFLVESELAFKFFRDKYNLYSYVEPVLVEEAKSPIKFDYVILGLDTKEENYNNLPYHTYEQARLECLKQLIKIVKNDTTN